MSRADGEVWVDGEIVGYFLYDGTCDLAMTRMFDSADAAWQAWFDKERMMPDHENCDEASPAKLYEDYGGGGWWPGTYCPVHRVVIGPLDPWDAGSVVGENWPIRGRPK